MNNLNDLSMTELKRLQSRGIIDVKIKYKPAYEGRDVESIPVTELEDFKPYKHLVGTGISISEASRRYNITLSVVSKWVKDGHVPQLGSEKNRKLIDEGYISYYSNKYHAMAKSGRRTDRLLFDQ